MAYILVHVDPSYYLEEGDQLSPAQTKMDGLRKRFLTSMRKECLNVLEERVGKHIFSKVFCSEDRMYKEAELTRLELPLLGLNLQTRGEAMEALIERKMKKIFKEMEADAHASAPFQRDCIDLFTPRDNPHAPILWPAIQSLLIHNILENINISRYNENGELPEKIGLTYLIMVGAFKDGFCAHSPSVWDPGSELLYREPKDMEGTGVLDPRKDLRATWGKMCVKQPTDDIRNYFGEKIAFYFAWISTLMSSLWIPAGLGLGVFIYGVVKRIGTLTKEGKIDVIEIVKESSDNELTPPFAAIICLWGTIFMEVWKRRQISLARRWHVDNFDYVESDRPQFYGTKSEFNSFTRASILYYPFHKRLMKYFCSLSALLMMVILVFISVSSVILYRVYMTVSFCKPDDSFCDLLHGTILATFLNTISIMILGKVYETIAVKLTNWENHQTMSEYNDALVIKLFAFQFANNYSSLFYTAFFRRDFDTGKGIFGLDEMYMDNCGHKDNDNCMSLLSFQLLVLMIAKPFPKFAKDVIWPCIKGIINGCKPNFVEELTAEGSYSKQSYLLREMNKPSTEDFRLSEFTEKIIQYGYLVLFAASFPLAPALALIFNIVDLRIDSRRLLWWVRRPTPYRDNDIGIWFHIIDFMNIFGVISNAFLIAFNSEFGRNESLFVKLAIVIGFEHFIFFIKFIISLIIPDVPTWVRNSQKKERFLVSYLMKKWNLSGTRDQHSGGEEDGQVSADWNMQFEHLNKAGCKLPRCRLSC